MSFWMNYKKGDVISKTCAEKDKYAKAYETANPEFVKGFLDSRKMKGK